MNTFDNLFRETACNVLNELSLPTLVRSPNHLHGKVKWDHAWEEVVKV